MTSYARFQLSAAIMIAAAYAVFLIWMMTGLTLATRSAEELGLLTLGGFSVLGALFAALWIVHLGRDGHRKLADEREEMIEARAERASTRVTDGALPLLVILALSDAKWGWMGSFALTLTEGLVSAVITISALAGIVRFVAGYGVAGRA